MTPRFSLFNCSVMGALLFVFPAASALAQGEETVIGGVIKATGEVEALPAGGISLVAPDALFGVTPGGKEAASAKIEAVAAENQLFSRALRLSTSAKTAEGDITLATPTIAPFAGVDTVFVRLYLRTIRSSAPDGFGSVKINLEQSQTGVGKAFYAGTVRAKPEQGWIRYDSPAMAMTGAGIGKARLEIKLGGEAQVIEIGGLEVLNYERRLFPHQLPHRKGASYQGREANAPWREIAQQSIEKHRKSDLRIQVQDAAGRAIEGANIEVKMTRHAYPFGTAVNEAQLISQQNTPDGQKYRETLKRLFNHAVLEGDHTWRVWDVPKNRERGLQTVAWLRENDIPLRGHTLLWPGWVNVPKRVKKQFDDIALKDGAEAAKTFLREAAREHIKVMMGAFRGQITDWVVVNETHTNHTLLDVLGEVELVEWFQLARELEPKIPLSLNEYNNLTASQKHTATFERHTKLLLERGAPLSEVGFQAHGGALDIAAVQENFDRFARLGLAFKITEFDSVTPDEQLQADWTRDLLTLTFAHPASNGFFLWGFWDGQHWLGDAPLFYPDWSLKPGGKAWMELVHGAWKTAVAGKSGANGTYATRGFLGDYEITVSKNGKSQSVKTTLPRQGQSLKVVL